MTDRILWDCLRFHLGRLATEEEAGLAQRLSRGGWEREAALHGMGGLLEAAALQLGLAVQPFTLRSQARINAAYEMECLHLSEVFARHQIPVMVLKGGALHFTLYAERRGWRPLRDLDLMVYDRHLDAAVALLLDQGYRPSPGGYGRKGLELDLHCDLWGSQRIPQRRRVWGIPPEEAWAASQPLWGDSWMRRLAAPHQFQHLTVHALKHSYRRLIWLADLAFLAQDPPPYEFAGSAQLLAQGVAESFLYDPLGGKPPERSIPWLAARLVDWIRQGDPPEFAGEVMVALLQPGWGERLLYLREILVPQEAELIRLYPSTPRPLLVWRRLLSLLSRLFRKRDLAASRRRC